MPSKKKDEGDFESVDLFLKLSKAADYTEDNKNKTEMELLVGNFNSLFAVLSETSAKDRSKFTWKYYVPYFIELKQQGHTEAFVYYIHQRGGTSAVNSWLQQNQNKVNSFLAWSKGYRWPKAE